MYFKSKQISLITLGLTAIVSSRTLFALFDDPEGPNLLVVTVAALIIYLPTWALYSFIPTTKLPLIGLKRLLCAILVQVLLVVVFYFCLR